MPDHDDDSRQQGILREAREFVDNFVRPRAQEFDREGALPRELIAEMAARRYLLASVPEAHGGLGLSPVNYGLFTEEIGKACASTRGLVTVESSLIGETLVRWGTQEQRARWLSPIVEEGRIGAFALTEPDVGSDARSVQTAYEKRNEEYVLAASSAPSGSLCWAASHEAHNTSAGRGGCQDAQGVHGEAACASPSYSQTGLGR